MSVKVEKTENKNEMKLEFTIEAKNCWNLWLIAGISSLRKQTKKFLFIYLLFHLN